MSARDTRGCILRRGDSPSADKLFLAAAALRSQHGLTTCRRPLQIFSAGSGIHPLRHSENPHGLYAYRELPALAPLSMAGSVSNQQAGALRYPIKRPNLIGNRDAAPAGNDYYNAAGSVRTVFTRPVWNHVQVLLIGALLCCGPRTLAAVLRVVGLGGEKRFEKHHRVLNRARWSGLQGAKILLGLW